VFHLILKYINIQADTNEHVGIVSYVLKGYRGRVSS